MDESAASPERLGKVVPLRVAAQPPPPLEQLVEQTFRIAIGMTALASEVLAEAVARTLGREPFAEGEAPGDETARPASGVPLVAGAAIGVALEGAKWGARAATTMVRSAELFFSLVTSPGFVQEPLRQAGDRLGGLDARWREQRPRDEEAAAAFLRLLVPQVVDAALDQIDLNELVAERIELDRIIDGLDLDRVIATPGHRRDRGPDRPRPHHRTHRRSQAIVERVPIDEIVSRLDLDAIVASVDLDQVVRRVDIQAVADRIDLQALVRSTRPHGDRERGDRGAQPHAADPGRDGLDDERDRRWHPRSEHERRPCDLASARTVAWAWGRRGRDSGTPANTPSDPTDPASPVRRPEERP